MDQEYILTELGCQEKRHGKSLLLEQILHTYMSTFTQFLFIAITAKCLNQKFIHWFEYKSKLGRKTLAREKEREKKKERKERKECWGGEE